MKKRTCIASAVALLLWAAPTLAQVGSGGVVGGTRPATRSGSQLIPSGGGSSAVAPATAVPIVSVRTFPAAAPDPIERAEFMTKSKPIAKNITSATAMMVVDGPDGELGLTDQIIATVVAGSRTADPLSSVAATIDSFAGDAVTVRAHAVVRGFSDSLKDKPAEARDEEIKRVANVLLADTTFVRTHAAQAKFLRDKLVEATQKFVFVKKHAEVGTEMVTSFEEAVRAIGMRYPKIDAGRIEFSFGDKYTPHEGGSAGTCFAVMMLSQLEGFEIDSNVAVTGDITVDWKVKKIGGVAAKVRGATAEKRLFAGVPLDNREQLNDMALYFGDASVRDIQVFTLATLQDGVALLRKDRSPQLTEAIKEFTALSPKLKAGRTTFSIPANQKVLENILALAPNHESARMILEMGKGTFPRTLTPRFAIEQLFRPFAPYYLAALGRIPVTRQVISAAQTAAVRRELQKLAPMSPQELQPILTDMRSIVDICENMAQGQNVRPEVLRTRFEGFVNHMDALDQNRDFREKLMRSGS